MAKLFLKWKGMLEWGKAGTIIGLDSITAVAQAGQLHVGPCHDSCRKFVLLVLTSAWVEEDWPERGSESNALIRFPGTPGTSALCVLAQTPKSDQPWIPR